MATFEIETLIELNLSSIITETQQQFEKWQPLKISWFGKVAVVKMKILPKFIFVFRNLILPLFTMY